VHERKGRHPHVPKTEKRVLTAPRFFTDLFTFLGEDLGHDESLRSGQINYRERARIFHCVPEWATTVI
jgi:hypothetical protein